MRVSRANALAIAASLALTGCIGGGAALLQQFPALAPKSVAVSGGEVIVQGPSGFCVDPRSRREGDGTSFAMLGACSSIANSARADRPSQPAVLSVAVSDPGELIVADAWLSMQDFLATEAGRASLARDGNAASVEPPEVRLIDEVLVVTARDTSPAPADALDSTYWRGIFNLGDRIVTVSVYAHDEQALSDSTALRLLFDFVGSIRNANNAA